MKNKYFNEKRDKGFIGKLFYSLYKIKSPKVVRKLIIKLMWNFFGIHHQLYSQTLRKIFKNYHNVEIGLYTHGSCFFPGTIAAGTKIGRYCSFAMGITTHEANHPTNTKSTHALFFNPRFGFVNNLNIPLTKLEIGNDVWIGYNAIILPGCKSIGNGAVIGAGAVVNKDIPPYGIVVGNPARVVMKRFSNETITELQETRWWEKDIDELANELDSFTVPIEANQIK